MFMRRILNSLIASSLVISSVAAATTTSGSVTLSGTVTTTLDITSTDTAGASALNMSAGQQIAHVADIAMTTNNDQGLTLTATAGNLSKAGGVDIAFQVTSVANGGLAPVSGAFASGTHSVGSLTAGAVEKDLYIMYSPASSQDPGTYAGSITLTVSDN